MRIALALCAAVLAACSALPVVPTPIPPTPSRPLATPTTPAVTPTTAPTLTPVPPTATVAPATATPQPPSPTPVPQPDADEAAYAAAIAEQSRSMAASLDAFSGLLAEPKLADTTWRVKVAAVLILWQATYQQARELKPSDRLKPTHEKYLAGLAKFDGAATDMADFLDRPTSTAGQASGKRATVAMTAGRALILEATRLMPVD